MADILASALLGQFAEEITPAGQTVFGLKAQPFADNNGAALGDIHDTDRGNVSITLARKAALVTECQRIGLTATGTAATLRAALQRANTRVMTQIPADWARLVDTDIADGLTDPSGSIDVSAMTFSAALIEITPSVVSAPTANDAAFAAASIPGQAGLLRLAKQAVIRLRRTAGAPPPGAAPPPAVAPLATAGGAPPPGVAPPPGLFGSSFGGAPSLGHTDSEPFVHLIKTREMMVIGAATDDQLQVLAPTGDGDGVALSRKAAQLLVWHQYGEAAHRLEPD